MNRLLYPGDVVAHRLGVLSLVLALALPLPSGASRADAVLIATILSFAVYTVVAIWVFCARSALRAWVGLTGVAVFAGSTVLALRIAS